MKEVKDFYIDIKSTCSETGGQLYWGGFRINASELPDFARKIRDETQHYSDIDSVKWGDLRGGFACQASGVDHTGDCWTVFISVNDHSEAAKDVEASVAMARNALRRFIRAGRAVLGGA